VPSVILVAPAEHLEALKKHAGLAEARVFSDADVSQALAAILRDRPDVVALERLFAATSRGAALIRRIKDDPSLDDCEIRVVAHDSAYSRVSRRSPRPGAREDVAPRLDPRGTRRAPRFGVANGVEVLIDGNPASLVTVSAVGAEVVSASILKPNQRVRIWLHDPARPIRFSGAVVWAQFEIPKEGPRYRAGIEFHDADPEAVSRFIGANRKSRAETSSSES
jgi:hypothetical protein